MCRLSDQDRPRWWHLWKGHLTESITKKVKWSFPALSAWLEANDLYLTTQNALDWLSEHVATEGSLNICHAALSSANYLAHCQGQIGVLDGPVVRDVLTKLHKKYTVDHKVQRRLLKEEDIHRMAKKPTTKTNIEYWQCFIWILWCFALRPGEIVHVLPQHLEYNPPTRGNPGYWVLTVVKPKVRKLTKIHHVRLCETWCPPEAIAAFRTFANTPEKVFLNAGTSRFSSIRRKLCAYLRDMCPGCLPGEMAAVAHTFRHGRVTQLANYPFSLPPHELQTVGRWAVIESLRVYMQF